MLHINISFESDSLDSTDAAILTALAAVINTKGTTQPTNVSAAAQPQPEVGENTGTSASESPSAGGAGVSGEAGGNVSAASPAPENTAVMDGPTGSELGGVPPKKRGRPSEAEKAARAAAAAGQGSAAAPVGEPASGAVTATPNGTLATPGASSAGATTGGDAKPITADDVLASLQAFTAKHSVEAGVKLLAEFGATRRSELKPEQFAEFVRRCSEEVTA